MVVLATVAVVVVIIVGLVFAPVRVLELKGVPLLGPEPLPTVLDPIDVRDSVEGNLFKPGLIVVDWRNELGARVTMFGVHMMDWVRSTRKAERRWKVEGRRSPLIQKAGLS